MGVGRFKVMANNALCYIFSSVLHNAQHIVSVFSLELNLSDAVALLEKSSSTLLLLASVMSKQISFSCRHTWSK